MKPKIGIRDGLFLHAHALGTGGDTLPDHPTYFEWDRSPQTPVRFYTDFCFNQATMTENGREQPRPRVAMLVEGPLTRPDHYKYLIQNLDAFDFVLTYYRYFLEKHTAPDGKWLFYPRGGTHVAQRDWGLWRKTRMVSLIGSGKHTSPGHELRTRVYNKFRDSGLIEFLGPISGGPFIRKADGITSYRYTVVIAAENIDWNICDHLIDPLATGTVPIFWGCPDIGSFFDSNGIIMFNDEKDLEYILKEVVSEDDYISRLPAIEANLEAARKYRFSEDWIFEQYPFLFE